MYVKVSELMDAFKSNNLLWHIAGQNITKIVNKLPKHELKQAKEKKVKK